MLSVHGSRDRRIERVEQFDPLTEGETLSFFTRPLAVPESFSGVVLCHFHALPKDLNPDATYVCCGNPRLALIRVLEEFADAGAPFQPGISSLAAISPKAQMGVGVSVGAFCSVGESRVGDRSVLYPGVHIYSGVQLGKNTMVDAGSIIGSDGYAYERNERGLLEHFKHLGGVVIEDDVDIGANVTIDRGTLSDTVIGRGTKIDNGAYIAHNVRIGEDSLIMAHSTICGSARIGKRCWLAPSSVIRDGICIGDDATVGLGAVVVADVPAGATVYGNPARAHQAGGKPPQPRTTRA